MKTGELKIRLEAFRRARLLAGFVLADVWFTAFVVAWLLERPKPAWMREHLGALAIGLALGALATLALGWALARRGLKQYDLLCPSCCRSLAARWTRLLENGECGYCGARVLEKEN